MDIRKRHLLTPFAGVLATALTPGQQVLAQSDDDGDAFLEEVIVTATKRSVSVQDIAATVQAITSEDLVAIGRQANGRLLAFYPFHERPLLWCRFKHDRVPWSSYRAGIRRTVDILGLSG